MKKLLTLLLFFIAATTFAQPIATGTAKAGKYVMNIPDLGTVNDSLCVWNGTTKKIDFLPISSLPSGGGGSTDLDGTLGIGDTATGKNINLINESDGVGGYINGYFSAASFDSDYQSVMSPEGIIINNNITGDGMNLNAGFLGVKNIDVDEIRQRTGTNQVTIKFGSQSADHDYTIPDLVANRYAVLKVNGTAADSAGNVAITAGVTAVTGVSPMQFADDGTGGRIGSMPVATSSVDGYLDNADFTTFNGKQPQLSGTGFVKASGTTINYDNSTYTVANSSITGATKTKITYDAKGLVTSGADLAAADLPTGIDAAKIGDGSVSTTEYQYINSVTSNVQTQITAKQAKRWVSPDDYGAVGDGTTNDATALQSAMSSGFNVWIPAKTYFTTSTITIPSNISIRGDGILSRVSSNSNIAILELQGNDISIDGIGLLGGATTTNTAQYGIAAIGNGAFTTLRLRNTITNCNFTNIRGAGIYGINIIGASAGAEHQGCYNISNCQFNGCRIGIFFNTRMEYNTISNCNFMKSTVSGVWFVGGNNNMTGGQITDGTLAGVTIQSGTNDGHSSIVGTKINHNTTNIDCSHGNNFVFSGVTSYGGHITHTGTGKTIYDACQFSMTANTLTITNSPTTFSDCEFATIPGTYTLTGAKPLMVNTYNGTSRLVTPTLAASDFTNISATYTITAADKFVNATANTFTATLPSPVGISGFSYTIKNSGTGTVTIATAAGNIDGVSTKMLNTQYGGMTVTSDNTNWVITATF